ncbi:hypothetical protein ACEOIC_20120 [Pseudomonas aeruginosa]|uniref:hypothetical protein n=1 Tax=Pseudomonas TaxID=286 RepID=UPI000F8755D5|nr:MULTISPECIES: hypothetical protein [Pseudomonas]MCD2743648.1 hypothetical protein [Pseudomonas aeruginosa]MCO1941598.1 hypothetical protein [Pseudomonas aeruginosa]MCO3864159.1 hypothetical protein [Pseudomonas aeruginosa]MDA3189724.1 hypothetical protein [Pseudomonas aeruginosa]NPW75826.1 hypothetical protein [Pseudomonas aeruginosa]
MRKKMLLALVATAAATAQAGQAIEVEPAYVAYAEVPGPVRNAPSFDVLISMESCPAKGSPSGWKRAAYMYSHGEEAACWILTGTKVKVCPQGQYETGFQQTSYGATTVIPCHQVSKNDFYNINR